MTSLILSYVEHEGGRAAVDQVLAGAGLAGCEEILRDENRWFGDQRRVDLYRAAAEVFDDPQIARRIGAAAVELNIGHAVKLALRSLGSPRLVYSNIVRANARFTIAHDMALLSIGEGRATLRNEPAADAPYDPFVCDESEGMLSCVPMIFGLPAARVRHPRCIGRGDGECVFEVEWKERRFPGRRLAAGLAVLGGATALVPALLPISLALTAIITAAVAARGVRGRRAHRRLLEARVREQGEAAERMMTSLKDLVSALDLDEVLAKITENAQGAIGGAEFALLTREEEGYRCRGSDGLTDPHLEAVRLWAERTALPLEGSVTIDDLRSSPELASLCEDAANPVGALCAAPLVSRGELLGVLVALSRGLGSLLPRDVVQLESYAAQAAIALTNARLYAAQQELASEDPLTGLRNHRHFHESLVWELDRCRRYGTELGLAIFDLDGFKLVNDHDGHAEGDRVLRGAAAALRRAGRPSDIAFRIGGDEFALILPGTGRADAAIAAERAAAAIDGTDPRIRASWGVASWPGAGLTKDELLAAADEAMYGMKNGRDAAAGLAPRGAAERRFAQSNSAEQLGCVSRLAVRLAPLRDPSQIATVAVDELVSAFTYNLAAILRLDGERLQTITAAGPLADRAPDLGEWRQSIEHGVIGRAARTGMPVRVVDTRADPAFLESGRSRSRSELDVPIRAGGVLWGVLNLESVEVDAFTREDLVFAETVAAACGAAIHRSELYAELESAFTRTLAVLSDALEAKDSYTAAHAREVAEIAERVAVRFGMDADGVRDVGYAALLHDIGKIGVRSEILHKPGPLSAAEYEEVKRHTVIGAQMLERIPFFAAVHPIVRSSHERWDGTGYPDRLFAERIPPGARIIAACDAFHAMTSDRPYRDAMSMHEARAELRRGAGTQFDPEVVRILLALLEDDRPDQTAAGGRAAAAVVA